MDTPPNLPQRHGQSAYEILRVYQLETWNRRRQYYHDATVRGRQRRHIERTIAPNLLHEQVLDSSSHGAAYRIVNVPGKGMGVVAARLISKYETIMLDYASVLVDLYFPSSVKREEGYTLLHLATDQLENRAGHSRSAGAAPWRQTSLKTSCGRMLSTLIWQGSAYGAVSPCFGLEPPLDMI